MYTSMDRFRSFVFGPLPSSPRYALKRKGGKNVTRHFPVSPFLIRRGLVFRISLSRVWSNRWPYKEDPEDRVGK